MNSHKVFISYSHHDSRTAESLYEKLESVGCEPWIDIHCIGPGEPYARAIMKGLAASECVVVIISRESMASEDVLNEIDQAHKDKKWIIPYLIDAIKLNPEFSYYLSRKESVSVNQGLDVLVEKIIENPSIDKSNNVNYIILIYRWMRQHSNMLLLAMVIFSWGAMCGMYLSKNNTSQESFSERSTERMNRKISSKSMNEESTEEVNPIFAE